jgi:hypothetical protein
MSGVQGKGWPVEKGKEGLSLQMEGTDKTKQEIYSRPPPERSLKPGNHHRTLSIFLVFFITVSYH